ncbi:MAG: DedA family protein [Deltaproteobacteria bacterium]|nr:DedA family protein [Deltaproteobacteria bacterium]
MGLTEALLHYITELISFLGYTGVFVLMTCESMVTPVPSEMVMPFAGFLVHTGQFTMLGVLIASTAGSITGSLLSYWMGRQGEAVVLRYGRYLMLNVHHLEWTEKFFFRYGSRTIFISRFIPVVRHLISIPAGLGKMNLVPFIIYTAIGATMWNMFLAYLGLKLKEHWEVIHHYSHTLDIILVVGTVLGGAAYFLWWRRRPKKAAHEPAVDS